MSVSLRLVSINIERSKHLDSVSPFITREAPDVLCVQELMERDVEAISSVFHPQSHVYFSMSRIREGSDVGVFGLGIFSRSPITRSGAPCYVGPSDTLPDTDSGDARTFNNQNRAVQWCDMEKEGETFRIGTTHFTWTPHGAPDDAQRRDVTALLHQLDALGDMVLCGDFNAPRGGEIFARIAQRYTDTIPATYDWSLDPVLHRAGDALKGSAEALGLPGLMVDGLFSTPGYLVSEVRLESGVSDHMAIVATVEKEVPTLDVGMPAGRLGAAAISLRRAGITSWRNVAWPQKNP